MSPSDSVAKRGVSMNKNRFMCIKILSENQLLALFLHQKTFCLVTRPIDAVFYRQAVKVISEYIH